MGRKKNSQTEQGEVAAIERERLATCPPMYSVWLLNDAYTPMDLVVDVLARFFNKTAAKAETLLSHVHEEGRAVCGAYPRDVAETKVVRVMRYARESGHPLQCVLEGGK